MADDQQPKMTSWNLRPFPEDLKRECNARAGREGKKDWKWLADYLRRVLPIIDTSEMPPADETKSESTTKVRSRSKRGQ
jgi:hypothetical protein